MNAEVKVPCLVAGIIGGADSIDGMDLLRHGAMAALFGGSVPLHADLVLAGFYLGNMLQLGR